MQNLALDVDAWEEQWRSLQQDGQELYTQLVTYSQRNKRLEEALSGRSAAPPQTSPSSPSSLPLPLSRPFPPPLPSRSPRTALS